MDYLIILYGAPGCGKGHLWSVLHERLLERVLPETIAYIATGDLIREQIALKSEIGLQIAELVQSGQLVPDRIVDKLIANALAGDQVIKVLDGYPRTNSQFDALKAQLSDETEVIAVFRDTPVDVIMGRIAKRRVCKDCKTTHTSDDGCCPKCGGESLIRKDDAVIEARLEEFNKNTLPIWDRMFEIGNTLHVGNKTSEEIADGIITLIFE